jgi:hypothetical protein
VVLDFDDLKTSNSGSIAGYTYSAKGFTLTSSLLNGLHFYSDAHPYNADPGGAALLQNFRNMSTTVSRTDGGLFDFLSLDVTDWMNSGRSTEMTFTFTDALGASTSQIVSTDNLAGLETLTFNKAGLKSFTLSQAQENWVQFDNMVLSATGVPEPATWAMLLMGFFGLGGVIRASRPRAAAIGRA